MLCFSKFVKAVGILSQISQLPVRTTVPWFHTLSVDFHSTKTSTLSKLLYLLSKLLYLLSKLLLVAYLLIGWYELEQQFTVLREESIQVCVQYEVSDLEGRVANASLCNHCRGDGR